MIIKMKMITLIIMILSVIRGVNSIAESCGPNSKVLLKLGNLDFKPEKVNLKKKIELIKC